MTMQLQQKNTEGPQASRPNLTGIPTQMKLDFERRSGLSFDDVRVHYNSDKPAQLRALAYTQGTQVYIGPGQEQHLPHELGHVIQQKSQTITPDTVQNGVPINRSQTLERLADRYAAGWRVNRSRPDEPVYCQNSVVQCCPLFEEEEEPDPGTGSSGLGTGSSGGGTGSSGWGTGSSGWGTGSSGWGTGSSGWGTGSSGWGTGSSGWGTGSSGLGTGSSGLGTGSSGLGTWSSGWVTGSSGWVTGSSGWGTGSSGLGTGSSGWGTGSSGWGTGSSGWGTGSSGWGTGSSGLGTGSSGLGTGSSGWGTGSSGLGTETPDLGGETPAQGEDEEGNASSGLDRNSLEDFYSDDESSDNGDVYSYETKSGRPETGKHGSNKSEHQVDGSNQKSDGQLTSDAVEIHNVLPEGQARNGCTVVCARFVTNKGKYIHYAMVNNHLIPTEVRNAASSKGYLLICGMDTHAEANMILYAMKHRRNLILEAFGCDKPSCPQCVALIQAAKLNHLQYTERVPRTFTQKYYFKRRGKNKRLRGPNERMLFRHIQKNYNGDGTKK